MLEIPFGHTLAAFVDVLGDFSSLSATLARRRKQVTLMTTGENIPQLSNDQIVVSGILKSGSVTNIHYRSGISAGTNFLWEINGTKGDIIITGGLGHYQLSPVNIQFGLSGSKLQPFSIIEDTFDKILTAPEQPIKGVYYAYKAIINDLQNDTNFVPDFNAGLRIHKLLDNISNSALDRKEIIL